MKKEKVYIVVSHKHILKTPGSKDREPVWDVSETVEFVNQLRNKHLTMSSAIGDYINRKMEKGERHGMGDYSKFEEYVRSKYAKEMAQLDAAYRADQVVVEEVESPEVFADEFGNLRARTVFDKAEA
jgi:hypothetical protein